ncbi:hypothetical protein DY468_09390 [Rhodopseudomonas sp. BR0M22]|nr:hypothetical protein [Rhodopseudomonas sp. BR0M22]
MPKWPMPKLSRRDVGRLAGAGAAAVIIAAVLSVVMVSGFGWPVSSVRVWALNVASLVVAFLLVAGVGRRQNDKR